MKNVYLILFTILIATVSTNAQRFSDPLFPEKGSSTLTIATGIPYVIGAEFSYGITDKICLGGVYANTTLSSVYGVRFRAAILERGDFE